MSDLVYVLVILAFLFFYPYFIFLTSRYTTPIQCYAQSLVMSIKVSKSLSVHGSSRLNITRCSIVFDIPISEG